MNFRTGLESDCQLGHFIETKRVGARNTMSSFFFSCKRINIETCKGVNTLVARHAHRDIHTDVFQDAYHRTESECLA